MESYKSKNKRPKFVEDADSLKVRLNQLIRLAEILVWLVALVCAIMFGIFIRLLLM